MGILKYLRTFYLLGMFDILFYNLIHEVKNQLQKYTVGCKFHTFTVTFNGLDPARRTKICRISIAKIESKEYRNENIIEI